MWAYWAFGLGLLGLAGVTRTQEAECEKVGVVSSGSGSIIRWTYDKSHNRCKAVATSDSGSGPNRFLNESDCLRRCMPEYEQLFPPGDAACDLPLEAGPCMAHLIMWYYNKERGFCDTFIWGGCQGNGNRFDSKETCGTACVIPKKGKSGATNSDPPSESQSDAGLIIGVVFGVVFGAAFLVTLAMYLVQRKKMKKQQHKRVPDTEMK